LTGAHLVNDTLPRLDFLSLYRPFRRSPRRLLAVIERAPRLELQL
jgi:hypothetical protein